MHACLFFFTPLPYSSSLMSSPLPPFLLPSPRAPEVNSHCSKLVSVGAPLFAHVHCAGAAAAVRSARPAVPVGAASSPSLSPPLHSPGVLLPPLHPTCWRSLFCAACTAAPSCTFCCWHTASDCALTSRALTAQRRRFGSSSPVSRIASPSPTTMASSFVVPSLRPSSLAACSRRGWRCSGDVRAACVAASPRSAALALVCAPLPLPIRLPSPPPRSSRCFLLCSAACTVASGCIPCCASTLGGELTLALAACASQRCCCGSPTPSLRVTSPSPTATRAESPPVRLP